MDDNKLLHHRHSMRLQGYDYTEEGGYFITIVTHEREALFGEVVDGEMIINGFGKIVQEEWKRSTEIRKEIELEMDEFVVMPNHIHGIVIINYPIIGKVVLGRDDLGRGDLGRGDLGRGDRPVAPTPNGPTPKSLGAFIAGYKSIVTKRINQLRGTPGIPVWQRNYYDHIIRDENDYDNIVNYIYLNPQNWMRDEEYR